VGEDGKPFKCGTGKEVDCVVVVYFVSGTHGRILAKGKHSFQIQWRDQVQLGHEVGGEVGGKLRGRGGRPSAYLAFA
jgi:hypothetical protein